MKTILTVLLWLAAASQSVPQFVPPGGFVPDAATAIAVARAVLIPIYGAATIQDEEPLVAKDEGDRWFVTGTMNCHAPPNTMCDGGTAELEVARSDGRILRMTHGR